MDWSKHPQVESDPEVVHGALVFKGTRLPIENALESYYAYRELEGLSDQAAIDATVKSFPTILDGSEGLRALLAWESLQERLQERQSQR